MWALLHSRLGMFLFRKRIQRNGGSRGGIRNRLQRRGTWFYSVKCVNSALTKNDSDYLKTSMFCFTETLSEDIIVSLNGFTFKRFDHDTRKTGKSIGGGLCMAVNDKLATNFTVRVTDCSWHEIMTVSFRPHYLPTSTFSSVELLYSYACHALYYAADLLQVTHWLWISTSYNPDSKNTNYHFKDFLIFISNRPLVVVQLES